MRDIKFRAWNNKEKFMMDSIDIHRLMTKQFRDYEFGIYDFMQYTGLKTIDMAEVYEGDILRIDKSIVEVVFYEGSFLVKGINLVYDNYLIEDLHNYECEIIGNIYENKELLKDTK